MGSLFQLVPLRCETFVEFLRRCARQRIGLATGLTKLTTTSCTSRLTTGKVVLVGQAL
jgi:hypothetical protein